MVLCVILVDVGSKSDTATCIYFNMAGMLAKIDELNKSVASDIVANGGIHKFEVRFPFVSRNAPQ